MNLRKLTLSNLLPGLAMLMILMIPVVTSAEKVTYSDSWGTHGLTLLQQNPNGVSLNFSVKEFSFSDRIVNGEMMKELELSGNMLQNDEGAPNLHLSAAILPFQMVPPLMWK